MKKCKNCKFYPKDCNYWDKKHRKKDIWASYVNENTNHNCPDFKSKRR